MSQPNRLAVILFGGGLVLGLLTSAYNALLHAPAAMAARPELAGLDVWTALFSGRFTAWLFYHEPLLGSVALTVFWLVVATIVWWLS